MLSLEPQPWSESFDTAYLGVLEKTSDEFASGFGEPDASPSRRPRIMKPGHNQTLQPCQGMRTVCCGQYSQGQVV